LQPELYLVRGIGSSSNCRLDRILLERANAGVKVFILLWWEASIAVGGSVCSEHTQRIFAGVKNIFVLRNPPNNIVGKWTHHQKFVVIDRQAAFVGGLDLCLGRYDRQDHPLVDNFHLGVTFPGKDFYNPVIREQTSLDVLFQDSLDRDSACRMPWHDVHVGIDGAAAAAVAINFIERWNSHVSASNLVDSHHLLSLEFKSESGLRLPSEYPVKVQIVRSLCLWSGGIAIVESSMLQSYLDIILRAEHFIYIENQFFISSIEGVKNSIACYLQSCALGNRAENKV
jgi:phospholipase D1/2